MIDPHEELSTDDEQYLTARINTVRRHVDRRRDIPNPNDWGVTPTTARLLRHWRSHKFSGIRPFFCQVEAAETAIWLTEVATGCGCSSPTTHGSTATVRSATSWTTHVSRAYSPSTSLSPFSTCPMNLRETRPVRSVR